MLFFIIPGGINEVTITPKKGDTGSKNLLMFHQTFDINTTKFVSFKVLKIFPGFPDDGMGRNINNYDTS